MTKICSRCGIDKSTSEFHFRNDTKRFRNQCMECWKYITASRRYNVSFEQAREFYKSPRCMCCKEPFLTKKQQHLHHVNHKVYGIICRYCNFALRQETKEDKDRINSCLTFISNTCKNPLNRVNQQGSWKTDTTPSTTACSVLNRQCNMCDELLPLSKFYKQKYKSGKYGYYASCKECHKIFVKTYKYGLTFEEVKFLRAAKYCDCCNTQLKIPYIHHVGDKVLGVLCRECNLLLEQESHITKLKLEACKHWLIGNDTVWSA